MDQNLAAAKRGRRLVGEWPGRQATVVELVGAWEREGPGYTESIRKVLQRCAAQMRTALDAGTDPGDMADAWDRTAGMNDEPARSALRRCAGEVRAALLAVEDPAGYRALSDGERPPPPPVEVTNWCGRAEAHRPHPPGTPTCNGFGMLAGPGDQPDPPSGLVFERPELDEQGIVRGYTEVDPLTASGRAGGCEIVFGARHVVNVLDRVIGVAGTADGHHNGYDSFACEKPGCGRPWWDDQGHHHLTAEVMRELGLL